METAPNKKRVKNDRENHMKRFWIPLSALFVFLFCILHPSEAVSGAAAGLSLWYCTVLPTLLPCMVLSGYLISTGLMEKMPRKR